MDKIEAIHIIHNAAMQYEKHFLNKNLLIVYGNRSNNGLSYSDLSFYETTASKVNFAHLTGTTLAISQEQFFNRAFENELSVDDFDFRDNTTFMKLDVIETALNVPKNFKICGNYNENSSHESLRTGFLVGGTNGSLRFCLDSNSRNRRMYVPNTLLKGDIRDETSPSTGILAVFSKGVHEQFYHEIIRLSDNIHIGNFLKELQNVLQIDNRPIQINVVLSQEQQDKDSIISLTNDLSKARSRYFKKPHDKNSKENYFDILHKLFDAVIDSEFYDYTSKLMKSQSKTKNESEAECINKERIQTRNLHTLSDILKNVENARADYIQNPDSESAMDRYIAEQERLTEYAVKTDLHDYIIRLLQSQQQRESPELASYIDDDIQAIHDKKLAYDTAPRKMSFSFSIRNNAFGRDNSDTITMEKVHTIAVTIPPKRPFKALIIKAQKLFRNITNPFYRAENPPDKTQQEEKNTSADYKEKSEKDETRTLEVYNMCVHHCDRYVEFLNTGDVMNSIELQTGLLFEQQASVQEHSLQQEQVQTEIKKKSKEMEYGD